MKKFIILFFPLFFAASYNGEITILKLTIKNNVIDTIIFL